MKYTLFLLALWSSIVQADWLCLPKTALTPFADGSAKVLAVTPAAESHAWWCQEATPAGAVRFFRPQYFTVLNKHRRAIDPFTVLQRAAAASAPMEKALSTEASAAQIIPITGSQDEYDYLNARYQACLLLATPPYSVPIDPLPANWCGVVPPSAFTHAVKANGTVLTRPAYLLTAGVRGTKEVARATVGQPCDLTKPTLASGTDVWAQFGPDFVAGRVALCAAIPIR